MDTSIGAILDPRPEMTDDSELWTRLFKIMTRLGMNKTQLYGTLHGFRCMGTRIIPGKSGGYVLRGDVDPEGRKAFYLGEYEELRDKYLKPHVKSITELMRLLKESEEGF